MKIFRKYFLYVILLSAAAALVLAPLPDKGVAGFGFRLLVFAGFGFLLFWIAERDILRDFLRISKALSLLPQKQKKAKKTGRSIFDFDTGVSVSISELSERISLQMRTTERERNQLKSIISTMKEGVIVISRDENLLIANDAAAEMFGFEETALDRPYLETVRNSDLQKLISRVRETKKTASQGIQVLYPKERSYLVSAQVSNRYGETIVIIFDITEFKKLERVKADFVANVSHELRTPLTSIKGCIETLMEEVYDTEEERRKFLGIINDNTDRLIEIASDLLTLSEIESGESAPTEVEKDREPINVREAVMRSTSSLESLFSEKSIDLFLEIEDGMPPLVGNRFLVERMLTNLVENSAKYTHKNGSVNVSAEAKNGSVRIEVRDDGIGIPAEHHERIFERFYRVDKDRSREIGGTGLGLSIVKHVVMQHGGTISVRSTEGKGSTFTVELPFDGSTV